MNKVLALKAALRCFTCGLLGFIPVLGIPFALAAMFFHTRASGHSPDDWNVAHRYGALGMFFAGTSLVLNVTAIVWFALFWIEREL